MTRASPSRERLAGAVLVALHLGAALALFIAFGFHSYHPTDHGFVVGAAWRVFQGEVPYRDFIWLKPLGTPYLHALALSLPEAWMLPATRLAYYVEMSAAALLPALWITRSGLARSATVVAVASLGGLAVALHNFPAMAWHTVDGVFAGSAGLAALGASITAARPERRILWRLLASLALFAAPLFKQGFAGLPLGIVAWAAWESLAAAHGSRKRLSLLLASIVPGALLLGAVVTALAYAGALGDAFLQLGRSSRIDDLVQAGFVAYGKAPHLALTFVGAVVAHAALAPASGRSRGLRGVAGVTMALATLWLATRPGDAGHPLFQLLLGAAAVRVFHWLRAPDPMGEAARRVRGRVVFNAGLLVLAWGASISWSQQTPLLGLAAAGSALADLVPEARRRWLGNAALVGVVLVAIAFLVYANWTNPYRDAPVNRQTADLSQIFPRFGGISTHPGHAERFAELAELIETFATNPERPFTVMRSFPAIHFLTGRRSPTRIDWYLALEVRGFRREHLADLLALDGIVFFQREAYVGRTPLARRDDTPCQAADFADSPGFVQTVYEAGRLVASTRGFCVVDMER